MLLGKYRVDGIMAEGGMGLITKAYHVELEQPVVIKILLPSLVGNAAIVQRFLREAQAIVRLRGEHIARVLDVGKMPDGTPFMVMEYLDGADLSKVLGYYGPQEPSVAADLIIQACEGLAEAHAQGIVHRDIKPSNFFVTKRPDGTTLLKILDFGISSAPVGVDSELTRTQSVIGTPAYMAPEQMRSARATDPRSDLWGLGVVLYQCLTGRRPWDAESYSELCLKVGMDPVPPIDRALPPGLEDIVRKCLEKSPDARYANAADLAWALVPFTSDPNYAAASAERTARILGANSPQTVSLANMSGPQSAQPKHVSRSMPIGSVATPNSANGAHGATPPPPAGRKLWTLVAVAAGGLAGAGIVSLAIRPSSVVPANVSTVDALALPVVVTPDARIAPVDATVPILIPPPPADAAPPVHVDGAPVRAPAVAPVDARPPRNKPGKKPDKRPEPKPDIFVDRT